MNVDEFALVWVVHSVKIFALLIARSLLASFPNETEGYEVVKERGTHANPLGLSIGAKPN